MKIMKEVNMVPFFGKKELDPEFEDDCYEEEFEQERFTINSYYSTDSNIIQDVRILKDKKTGVQYLIVQSRQGGVSVTPLLDSDGKPITEKTEQL